MIENHIPHLTWGHWQGDLESYSSPDIVSLTRWLRITFLTYHGCTDELIENDVPHLTWCHLQDDWESHSSPDIGLLTRWLRVTFLTWHGCTDEVIKISIGGSGQLERLEADVVESFIVDAECLVRVFDELMKSQRRIIWLHHNIGHLQKIWLCCRMRFSYVSRKKYMN